jgi:nicotinic acid mononucleotide adenylyltransferase
MDFNIKSLQDSDLFFRILEVGAGMPISNQIFEYEGASKVIYSAESYYSKDAFNQRFGKTEIRAVSAEHLWVILNDPQTQRDLENKVYNSLVATSFQLGENISNHGWILISTPQKTRYYHISLPHFTNRRGLIKDIGYLGVYLMTTHIHNTSLGGLFIDIILDEHLQPVVDEILSSISDSNIRDTASVFTPLGSVERLEYITRDAEYLILYKGSFNPISISHKEIMEESKRIYNTKNTKAVFCLSFNTFEKGRQSIESFKNTYFRDLNQLIINKYSGHLVFVAGVDTMNRLVLDFIDHELASGYPIPSTPKRFHLSYFKDQFKTWSEEKNTLTFLTFSRDSLELHPDVLSIPRVKLVTHNRINVSSTEIRKYLAEEDYESVRPLLPAEIYSLVIKTFV